MNLSAFQNIYGSSYPWTTVPKALRGLAEGLFVLGDLNDLIQLNGESPLPKVPNPADKSFIAQAAYQHHGKTYQALIQQQFPKD